MSLGADSVSWWESNGPGCKVFFYPNHTGIEEDAIKPVRPDLVTGCIMDYQTIETGQASLQILLAVSYYLFKKYIYHSETFYVFRFSVYFVVCTYRVVQNPETMVCFITHQVIYNNY